MQRLERGYERLKQRAKEKMRNLVPIHANSFEELIQLAEREHAVSLQVRSWVQTLYSSTGSTEWAPYPMAVSSPPDAYMPKTRYEARGLGRRIVMDEIHPEFDGISQKDLQSRCALTAEHRREMLAGLLPKVSVSIDKAIKDEEEYKRELERARAGLKPYEVSQEDKEFFGKVILP